MTGPEDRDSGTKPPPPPPDRSSLPPRLREKLDAADAAGTMEFEKKSPAGLIIGVIVAIVVIAAGWWFINNMQVKAKAEAARAAARAAAVADSIAQVRMADSLAAVARADSIDAFNKLPKWKQRQIVVQQARAAGKPVPAGFDAEAGPFAIDAAEFLFEDAAKTGAEALKASTKLSARVASTGAGGSYHVYLGQFDDRDEARRVAASLITKGLVEQARVVPVPGR
jgi:hypothetical protein